MNKNNINDFADLVVQIFHNKDLYLPDNTFEENVRSLPHYALNEYSYLPGSIKPQVDFYLFNNSNLKESHQNIVISNLLLKRHISTIYLNQSHNAYLILQNFCTRYAIKTWGGIRGGKSETLACYTRAIQNLIKNEKSISDFGNVFLNECTKASLDFNIIAKTMPSWSKALTFAFPNKCFIYDAHISLLLNKLWNKWGFKDCPFILFDIRKYDEYANASEEKRKEYYQLKQNNKYAAPPKGRKKKKADLYFDSYIEYIDFIEKLNIKEADAITNISKDYKNLPVDWIQLIEMGLFAYSLKNKI